MATRTRTATGSLPRAHAAADLESLAADEWDALVRPGLGPLRHAALRSWERCELAALRSRPILVRAGAGELLAAAPGYLYDLDAAMIQRTSLRHVLAAARRLRPRLLMFRVFELGSPAPRTPPFLHAPDVDALDAADALLAGAVEEAASEGADMVVAQDFLRESPWEPALEAHGFTPIPMHSTVVLDLPFDSFEEYLAAMRANYRRRAKVVLGRSQHLCPEVVHDFAPLAGELARLWRLVYERATEYRREILPPAYFEAAAQDEATSALVLRRPDDTIASFALLLEDAPWLHFLSTGFAERAGRDEGAYFRLLYEIARLAIERGLERVNLGLTTVEPKLDVGGRAVPLAAWLRHRNGMAQRAMTALGGGPFAPKEPEPRRVFRD